MTSEIVLDAMFAPGTPNEPNARHVQGQGRERTASENAASGRLSPSDGARGMISFRVDVDPREVVFIKSLVEASEGIASIFADHGGCLTFATPAARRSALVELLDDLVAHHGARVEALDSADDPIHGGGR